MIFNVQVYKEAYIIEYIIVYSIITWFNILIIKI